MTARGWSAGALASLVPLILAAGLRVGAAAAAEAGVSFSGEAEEAPEGPESPPEPLCFVSFKTASGVPSGGALLSYEDGTFRIRPLREGAEIVEIKERELREIEFRPLRSVKEARQWPRRRRPFGPGAAEADRAGELAKAFVKAMWERVEYLKKQYYSKSVEELHEVIRNRLKSLARTPGGRKAQPGLLADIAVALEELHSRPEFGEEKWRQAYQRLRKELERMGRHREFDRVHQGVRRIMHGAPPEPAGRRIRRWGPGRRPRP